MITYRHEILLLFPKRTENSIKNRFFSQLRKITSIHIQSKDKKFSSKIKLETLLHYLDEATEEVKIKYLRTSFTLFSFFAQKKSGLFVIVLNRHLID